MKLKVFAVAMLITGALAVFAGFGVPFIFWDALVSHGPAFAIIGHAGEPTFRIMYFRLMNGLPFCLAVLGGILVITGLVCLLFSKRSGTVAGS